MDTVASEITSLTIVYSSVYSGADQIKYRSPASLAVTGGFPHKGPITREKFPFDDVIMRDYISLAGSRVKSNNMLP